MENGDKNRSMARGRESIYKPDSDSESHGGNKDVLKKALFNWDIVPFSCFRKNERGSTCHWNLKDTFKLTNFSIKSLS